MAPMNRLVGWLLDLYPSEDCLTLWLLGDDGERHRLKQSFPVTFFASGSASRLRNAAEWCSAQPEDASTAQVIQRDLFDGSIPVLAITVRSPGEQPGLFRRAAQEFPDLVWYNVDLPLALRHSSAFGVFPLSRCKVGLEGAQVLSIVPMDTAWDLDPPQPPLRILTLEPECDPFHSKPKSIVITYDNHRYHQSLQPARALLVNLRSIFERYDPDLLLTLWGDTWLLPYLLELSSIMSLPLPLNRDPDGHIIRKKQRSYFAYGQVIYRGAQVHLAGRWHIDAANAVMYHDYGIKGVLELARVTGLPVQTVARTSPGTGISSMQMATALRQGTLIPWRKQKAESQKNLLDLLHTDMGGLVYQPTIGLHSDVAEIDFISMYPSIMQHFNISPETIAPGEREPTTGLPTTCPEPGLVPQTLEPLLQKRIALRKAMLEIHQWDPRRERYQAALMAHKWLLVTCFGYLGYKNARFGRIEAHEAVTAYGRETLLRAKEAAEDLGFEVLHLYVDGMWVKKPGCKAPSDFQPLISEIHARTNLPISLDGVFRWIAFVASRQNDKIPVANRYFGVFQNGESKVRGIELRRHDTPGLVRDAQSEMLKILTNADLSRDALDPFQKVQEVLHKYLSDLQLGRVPLEKLIVRLTLSRELGDYNTPSPGAVAAKQLFEAGKVLRPGQGVRLIYTLGIPKVRAWDLAGQMDPKNVDKNEYRKLLLRAARAILDPFEYNNVENNPSRMRETNNEN
jgi:DNA polymerase II